MRRLPASFRRLHSLIFLAGLFAPACAETAPDQESLGGAGNSASAGSGGRAPSGSAGMSGGRAGSNAGGSGKGGVSGAAGGSGGASAGGQPQGAAGAGGAAAGVSAGGQPQGAAGAGGAAAGASAGRSSGSAGGSGTHTGVWRIMPLGDSITQSTCYPQLLSKKLQDSAHTNFEFLGSSTNNQSCNGAPNVKSEGHGGYILGCLTGDYTSNCSSKGMPAELAAWLSAMPAPDVVLVHFGTNDVWNGIPTSTITMSYTNLLASLRNANPNVIVFIAQILPMHPDNCLDGASGCPNNGVKMLNDAIPGWATGASTATSPVYVVDAYNSMGDPATFVPNSANTSDGVHPNATGSGPIADAWMSALLAHDIPD